MSTLPPNSGGPEKNEDNPLPARGSSKFYSVQARLSRFIGLILVIAGFIFYSPENSIVAGFLLLLAGLSFLQVAYYVFLRNSAEKKEKAAENKE